MFQTSIKQLHDLGVTDLSLNSNQCNPTTAFVALQGAKHHGLEFAQQALSQGTLCILIDEKDPTPTQNFPCIRIPNLHKALAKFSSEFYDHPSKHLSITAITGTNGKTSCSQFLAQVLHLQKETCGVIGTLGMGVWPDLKSIPNTTPDAISLQHFFATMREQHVKYISMEASSIALVAGRMDECHIETAIFTNLTQDHLDYHGTMEAYAEAKHLLFQFPSIKKMIFNVDDAYGQQWFEAYQHSHECWTYSVRENKNHPRHIYATEITFNDQGVQAKIITASETGMLHCSLIGAFNLENVLAILAWLLAHGKNFANALALMAQLTPVAGRMNTLGGGKQPLVVVDFAHTPDALAKALTSLRAHCEGKLWCVFGCGGNRDKTKRPQMGKLAAALADVLLITSDNPRDESPESIAADILAGITSQPLVILDREAAIRYAIQHAASNDVILIAGKGHENYQEIKGERFPMSDTAMAEAALNMNERPRA